MLIRKQKSFKLAEWEKIQLGENKDWICKECWDKDIYTLFPCNLHINGMKIPEYMVEKSPHYRGLYESKLLRRIKVMDLSLLKKPFPIDEVKFRVGSTNKDKDKGLALAYIDARAVMDRLDEVCGQENWTNSFVLYDKTWVCTLGIRVERETSFEWVYRSDGAGLTDYEAEKGGISDSFKRAAVQFGIGRYLYGSPNLWFDIMPMGKSFKFKDEKDVRAKFEPYLMAGPKLPGTVLSPQQLNYLYKKMVTQNPETLIREVFDNAPLTDIAGNNLIELSIRLKNLSTMSLKDMGYEINITENEAARSYLIQECYDNTIGGLKTDEFSA